MNADDKRVSIPKEERVMTELEGAGIIHAHRHPFTTNYLPRVLHDDEHVMGAVFGRRKESEGFFGFVEGLLVATNKRVIYLDHRPGYTAMDEVSYDVISGASLSTTLIYASVTLYTKVANYKLSFANHASAQRFVDYIETRVLEHQEDNPSMPQQAPYVAVIENDARDFLESHEIGVLSSIERTGAVTGASVYYTVRDGYLYFMTKQSSKKAANILGNQHVAFTVFDEKTIQTMQLQGIVESVFDNVIKLDVITAITHPRTYADGSHKPPVVRMGTSDIQIYRIVPTKYDFVDYSKR